MRPRGEADVNTPTLRRQLLEVELADDVAVVVAGDELLLLRLAPCAALDMKHNFVVSYNYEIPIEKLFRSSNRFTKGWAISGVSRFSTGRQGSFHSFGSGPFSGATRRAAPSLQSSGLIRIDFQPILTYMCAARAHGFQPSKVFALCRSQDHIQGFSTKNGPVFGLG